MGWGCQIRLFLNSCSFYIFYILCLMDLKQLSNCLDNVYYWYYSSKPTETAISTPPLLHLIQRFTLYPLSRSFNFYKPFLVASSDRGMALFLYSNHLICVMHYQTIVSGSFRLKTKYWKLLWVKCKIAVKRIATTIALCVV